MTLTANRFRSLLMLTAVIAAGALAAGPALADLVWVASLTEVQTGHEGKPPTLDGAESMVLKRGETGWRIVHIHWSSRVRAEEP